MQGSQNIKQIACLYVGSKYDPIYVHKLYSMCRRNLNEDFSFIVFTDNPQLFSEYKTILVPKLSDVVWGWWYKLFIFSFLPLEGTILYLDLDVVVCGNMSPMWDYKPKETVFWNDSWNGDSRLNSSVLRFEANALTPIWTGFEKDHIKWAILFRGDQDFIRAVLKKYEVWPSEWIKSYKHELRSSSAKYKSKGKTYLTKGEPYIENDLKIAVMHGHPKQHLIEDEWVKLNWK